VQKATPAHIAYTQTPKEEKNSLGTMTPECASDAIVFFNPVPGATSYLVTFRDTEGTPPADHTITVAKDQTKAIVGELLLSGADCNNATAEANKTQIVRFKLVKVVALVSGTPEKYTLSGKAIDERNQGKPLQGVVLTLKGPKPGETATRTDGTYDFTGLPSGAYSLHVEAPGVCASDVSGQARPSGKTCEKTVSLQLDGNMEQNFSRIPLTLAVDGGFVVNPVKSGLTVDGDGLSGNVVGSGAGGGQCRSACATLRVRVTDLVSGDPVAKAEVTVSAPRIAGPLVVTPAQGGGYFCGQELTNPGNCANPLTVTTNADGEAPPIDYFIPGIVADSLAAPKALPVQVTIEAHKTGYRSNASSAELQIEPNYKGPDPSTLGRHEVTLSANDALFLNFWGTVTNAPSYLAEAQKYVGEKCEKVKKYTLYNLLFDDADQEGVKLALGTRLYDTKETFDGLCSFSKVGSKLTSFMNQGAALFELSWALRVFHLKGLGLVAAWAPTLFSQSPSDLLPALHSEFATSLSKAILELYRGREGDIRAGDRLVLDIYEVSNLPRVASGRGPEPPAEPGLKGAVDHFFASLAKPFTDFVEDFDEKWQSEVYLVFTALPVSFEPVKKLVSDGYEPAFWLNPNIKG
jgi:hypothetical protein